MPTRREREYYRMGYRDGRASTLEYPEERRIEVMEQVGSIRRKPKRNYPLGISTLKISATT